VPSGKLTGSTEVSASMSGLVRRLRLQLYHSLSDEVNIPGRWPVDGWVRWSVCRVAVVGPQVLVAKFPLPRNWV